MTRTEADLVIDLLQALPHCDKGVCLSPATCDATVTSASGFSVTRPVCEEHRSSLIAVEYPVRQPLRALVRAMVASGHTPWWCEDPSAWGAA